MDVETMILSEPDVINMSMDDKDSVEVKVSDEHYQTNNYEKLKNLPTLNGKTIIKDMEEIDPTVPDWAKEERPEEMKFASIKEVWDSVFKEE